MTKEYALIVAGGKGTRFGSSTPKQFLELNGKPVLLHTVEAFYDYSPDIQVVLVLPEEEVPVWHQLASRHNFNRAVRLVKGGSSRFQSVKNGLETIPDDAIVAVHDGVRPLVTTQIIKDSFELAALHGSAVASVPLKESLRIVDDIRGTDLKTRAVDRSLYRIIQTPQTFKAALIKEAYRMDDDPTLTDDASVAEKAGLPIYLFTGRYDNLKITTPEDLVVAAALAPRTGSL